MKKTIFTTLLLSVFALPMMAQAQSGGVGRRRHTAGDTVMINHDLSTDPVLLSIDHRSASTIVHVYFINKADTTVYLMGGNNWNTIFNQNIHKIPAVDSSSKRPFELELSKYHLGIDSCGYVVSTDTTRTGYIEQNPSIIVVNGGTGGHFRKSHVKK